MAKDAFTTGAARATQAIANMAARSGVKIENDQYVSTKEKLKGYLKNGEIWGITAAEIDKAEIGSTVTVQNRHGFDSVKIKG